MPTICILVGTQFGIATRGSFNHNALDMAEARARGMKLVVVDPVGGFAASKANEWMPDSSGHRCGLRLSMLHVLLNEARHLRWEVPEEQDQCALPGRRERALPARCRDQRAAGLRRGRRLGQDHDDPGLKRSGDPGSYEVQGKRGRPSFELLREHVAKYTPEVHRKDHHHPGRHRAAHRAGIRRSGPHRRRPSASTASSCPIGRPASTGPRGRRATSTASTIAGRSS